MSNVIRTSTTTAFKRLANNNAVRRNPRQWFSSSSVHSPSDAKVIKKAAANPKDPRTWPRAAALGFAAFLGGYFVFGATANQSAKVDERHSELKTNVPPYSKTEPIKQVAEKMPAPMDADKYDKISKEGLGVDHEEWKKNKEQKSLE